MHFSIILDGGTYKNHPIACDPPCEDRHSEKIDSVQISHAQTISCGSKESKERAGGKTKTLKCQKIKSAQKLMLINLCLVLYQCLLFH